LNAGHIKKGYLFKQTTALETTSEKTFIYDSYSITV